MNMITSQLQYVLSNFGPFFILLGILIFVHELGHFLVAKFFGVRVETFSLGFGKKIVQFKRGDTTYALSLIPLGGYVKMYGDDPTAEVPPEEVQYAFLRKPLYQRFAVVLAGPMMNLFFAVLIFSMIVAIGEDVPGPFAGDVATSSKAYDSGLRSGDKILQVAGQETATWAQVQKALEVHGGQAIPISVQRTGEAQPLSFDVPVTYADNENPFATTREVGAIAGLSSESRSTLVGIRDPKSPAGLAGVQSFMLITSINGEKVSFWRDIPRILNASATTESKTIKLQWRDLEKPDKNENLQTAEITLPADWSSKPDRLAALGLEPAELFIYQVKKGSPADVAGIQAKDRLLRIGSDEIKSWSEVLEHVKVYTPGADGMDFTVSRAGEEKTFKIKPEMTTLMNSQKGNEEHRFTIGITSGFFPVGPDSVFFRLSNPIQVLGHGIKETAYWTEFVVMSLVRLVQGEVSAKNIGGIITIGRVAAHSFAAGLSSFMRMMGLISINLFLLNLLPIPVLDGGHLLFYTIEGLRGAPLSLRKMEIAQQVGLMLLMLLMAFAFYNDITNLFVSRM